VVEVGAVGGGSAASLLGPSDLPTRGVLSRLTIDLAGTPRIDSWAKVGVSANGSYLFVKDEDNLHFWRMNDGVKLFGVNAGQDDNGRAIPGETAAKRRSVPDKALCPGASHPAERPPRR